MGVKLKFSGLSSSALTGRQVEILGLELVQSVQTQKHTVPLLAGKRTLARLYLRFPNPPANALKVRAELMVSAGSGTPAAYVSSMNEVLAANIAMSPQRQSLKLSLNFLLPEAATAREGNLQVSVKKVVDLTGASVTVSNPSSSLKVAVTKAPLLRLHCVGFRYKFQDTTVSPEPLHFTHLRSFLRRAYPISDVIWSQVVVDADARIIPPFGDGQDPDLRWNKLLGIAHNQLGALRAKDISTGTHRGTRYYGLFQDTGDFFRGAAAAIPDQPRPDIIAVGPCGSPAGKFGWDTDASYGDWYGAHELGHTFGRFHPGFCGQDASDASFPYPEGRISDSSEGAIGVDLGDADLGIPMRIYPFDSAHDLMTYCDLQWISPYTYRAILARLRAENKLFP